MLIRHFLNALLALLLTFNVSAQQGIIVFQSDFGLKDGAVSAMKGVCLGVSRDLQLFDLTHEIPAYNIWEASYRLEQTASYWPAGTVFVSVVDPGVGTARRSVVLKTKSGHYFVTPDNGTLTHIANSLGIDTLREIDEALNRRAESGRSYTFHGRDVYAFTAARLASHTIKLAEIGRQLPDSITSIPHQKAALAGQTIMGTIPILDVQYGNVWTNVPASMIEKLSLQKGDAIRLIITNKGRQVYEGTMPFVNTFGDVLPGKPLAYLNSLLHVSFAINEGNFASRYHVRSGPEWKVFMEKVR